MFKHIFQLRSVIIRQQNHSSLGGALHVFPPHGQTKWRAFSCFNLHGSQDIPTFSAFGESPKTINSFNTVKEQRKYFH